MNSNAPDTKSDNSAALRRGVYWVLIAVSVGTMIGRILAVDSVDTIQQQEQRIAREMATRTEALKAQGLKDDELQKAIDEHEEHVRYRLSLQRPFLSANDRSRWCTIRALIEPDVRVEGFPYAIDNVIAEPRWDTIDMVKAPNGHLYSSKPPLMPTLVAGVCWLVCKATGDTLGEEPYLVGRTVLIVINVLPLVIYFWLLWRLAERFGTTDWGRIFVVAAGTMATFISTFSVVLNNHVHGAVCAMVVLYTAVRIWCDGERRLRYFVICGLFAALLASDELPALSLFGVVSAALLWKAPRQTLLGYVPAAILVVAAFFATNWIAFHNLKPPYLHRSAGDNWYDYTYERNGKKYESYWNHPVGVDEGEPSPAVYAVQILVGHHGIFSLTPVWLLSFAGMGAWLLRGDDPRRRQLAAAVVLVTGVCLAFYLTRPLEHRNYGGMTSGLRWMFWFTPLWLWTMLPAADRLGVRPWTRVVGLVLLGLSVVSVAYPTWNPWVHPWLYNWMFYLGWIS